MDNIVGEWSRERGWFSKGHLNDDLLIVAPENWRVPDSSPKDEFFCEFCLDAIDADQNQESWEEDNQFWLTQLCGLGVSVVRVFGTGSSSK